jgi:hypothetical protein
MAAVEEEIASEEGSDGLIVCSVPTGHTQITNRAAPGAAAAEDTAAAAPGARV